MKKQRKEERRKVLIFTPVYDVHDNILLGYLGDLTPQGALMVSEKPVETNRQFSLAIEFREKSEIPAERMTLPVRVAWCRQAAEHLTYYNTGLVFQDVTEQNKKAIEAILEKYQFSL